MPVQKKNMIYVENFIDNIQLGKNVIYLENSLDNTHADPGKM